MNKSYFFKNESPMGGQLIDELHQYIYVKTYI